MQLVTGLLSPVLSADWNMVAMRRVRNRRDVYLVVPERRKATKSSLAVQVPHAYLKLEASYMPLPEKPLDFEYDNPQSLLWVCSALQSHHDSARIYHSRTAVLACRLVFPGRRTFVFRYAPQRVLAASHQNCSCSHSAVSVARSHSPGDLERPLRL